MHKKYLNMFLVGSTNFKTKHNLILNKISLKLILIQTRFFFGQNKSNKDQLLQKKKISNDFIDYEKVSSIKKKFFNLENDKEKFMEMIQNYSDKTRFRIGVGQCEFIIASLKCLKEFNLHKDLDIYKKLLNIMPKKQMVISNFFQEILYHYPKHQQTAMTLLNTMYHNYVMPDKEMQNLVISIFGERSNTFKLFKRIIYWISKMKYMNPFPLPDQLPNDTYELSKIALKRMCPDLKTKIIGFRTDNLKNAIDKTWILVAQSEIQKELIKNLNEPFYVKGPNFVFLRDHSINYFTLKTLTANDKYEFIKTSKNPFDVSNLRISVYGSKSVDSLKNEKYEIHKQEEGTVLAVFCTGTSSMDSVLSCIRILSRLDRNLSQKQIYFNCKIEN